MLPQSIDFTPQITPPSWQFTQEPADFRPISSPIVTANLTAHKSGAKMQPSLDRPPNGKSAIRTKAWCL
jgi:hypothetical protein